MRRQVKKRRSGVMRRRGSCIKRGLLRLALLQAYVYFFDFFEKRSFLRLLLWKGVSTEFYKLYSYCLAREELKRSAI